jgi:hypothetical protein
MYVAPYMLFINPLRRKKFPNKVKAFSNQKNINDWYGILEREGL